MSKTEVVLAFSQLPEDCQNPFKSLYPEIVPETPVAIVIDPEGRSLDFTVGAREMTFGPSNENYSVFLQGCYRMLFSAAQKQGWMNQFPTDGPAATVAEEAAPVVASSPAPPAPKQASNVDMEARVAALTAKLASLPKSPEVESMKAKLASVSGKVKTASSDPSPKPEDKLYVRPLDFVNTLRDDWNSWADEHGGQESMNKQGGIDILAKHQASKEASEQFGFTHEASAPWVNPKGLLVADDSKLVAQLRVRTAGLTTDSNVNGEAQLMGTTENPVQDVANGSVKEVATAKSASSLDFRPDVTTSSVKKAYSPVIAQAVNKYVAEHAGSEVTLPELKQQVKSITSSWKEMLHYMQDFSLLKAVGTDRVVILNRDLVADLQVLPTKMAAAKTAESFYARVWVKPDGSLVEVKGSVNDGVYHSTVALEQGFNTQEDAFLAGWVRAGFVFGTNGYMEFNADKLRDAQVHALQTHFSLNGATEVTLEDYRGGTSSVYIKDFYEMNAQACVKEVTRRNAYASVKKARNCNAEPVTTTFGTFPIRIDCPAGCKVSGVDPQGNAWESIQSVDYGEIIDTVGGDGEAIDVFLGPDTNAPWVFIVNQTKYDDSQDKVVPDEIKVGLGFWSLEDARDAYLSMFENGWTNYDSNIVTTSTDSLREWLESTHGAKNVTADDFTLTTGTPEVVQPTPVVAPEVFRSISNAPITSYVASVDHDIPAPHQADVLTMFQDPSVRPMDATSAKVATLFAKQTVDHTRGHQASFDAHTRASIESAVKVSVESHKANLTPARTSSSRIAEIITAELNLGYSPEECDHRASLVSYFGSDQKTFRRTLAKLAGIAGNLVLQPNFIKNSCTVTHAALNGQHKATRSKTPYHAVASTSACAGCTNYKCNSQGVKHCALYSKPIVASVEEMHKLANSVWGVSQEAMTPTGLSKRAAAHLASKNSTASKSPLPTITAAVDFGDGAESRPSPSLKASIPTASVAPKTYIVAALSQGQTPARIAEILDRSTVHSASFKEAAMAELNAQKGLMGFLTVMPHFAGSCSVTHGKHFAANAKDKRKFPFHSVTKIAACSKCQNCVKNVSGGERCSLYGKPLVSTLADMKLVAATAFPAMIPKLAAATKEDLAKEALPYLAQSIGVSEDHPSLKAFNMPSEKVEPEETELENAAVETEKDVVEGTSKNVMDIAMEASKPKTQDLEAITTKIKEAFVAKKTPQQVYDSMKIAFRAADRPQLQRLVSRIAGQTNLTQSQSSANGEVYTEITTNDNVFGDTLKQLAEEQIAKEQPTLTDGIVDINEMSVQSDTPEEFGILQDYIR